MIWIVIIVLIVIIVIYYKSYKIRFDTVIAFTGGLGAGKSFLSSIYARKLIKSQRRRIFIKNIIKNKKNRLPRPMLYSSIPVRISKKENSIILKPEHLLIKNRIIPRSVIYIDEIGSFATQFDFNDQNIIDNFDEFIRLYRHYTKGGYIVCNDQCSENIVLQVRRRINTVHNLMQINFYFGIIYRVKIRHITVSEEIKSVEEQNTEDSMATKWGIVPLIRLYDTYCYSGRYEVVPYEKEEQFKMMKINKMLKKPRDKVEKLTRVWDKPPEETKPFTEPVRASQNENTIKENEIKNLLNVKR